MSATPGGDGARRSSGADERSTLRYRDGYGDPRRFPLDDARPRLLLGRGSGCDLVIDWDDQVSRQHARLEPVGGRWLLLDDGLSRNGTWVNGERVTRGRRLAHVDRILVGRTLLTFRAGRPQTSPPTAGSGAPLIPVTASQRQVLVVLCGPLTQQRGALMPATNRSIAAELHLSVDTVKDHLSELFTAFRVADLQPNEKRLALARRALAAGMV